MGLRMSFVVRHAIVPVDIDDLEDILVSWLQFVIELFLW